MSRIGDQANYYKTEHEEAEEWLNNLHEIKRSINPDLIDMDDERTRYIMSK